MTELNKISPSFDAFFEDHDPDAKHQALVIYHPPRTRQTEALSKSGRLRVLSNRLAFIQQFAAEQRATQHTLAANYHAEVSPEFAVSAIGNNTLPVMAVEIERKTLPVLAAQPEVAAILPNQRIQLIRPTNVAMTTLRSFEKQLGMTWGLRTLGIPMLWEAAKNKGQGVCVAVLDTGVDAEHPVLSGRVNAFSLIDPLGQRIAATPYFDGSNHGTHVCGTIAGQAMEDGVQIGIAPECELLVGAILVGEATVHTFIEGVSWALDHGADIINMSFGTTYYEPRFDWTLAILGRQEGRMSLMIDDLNQSSYYQRRTSHAAPARRDHTGLGPLRATLFGACLAPCPMLARGGDAGPWNPHGHGRPTGDGAGHGTPLHP